MPRGFQEKCVVSGRDDMPKGKYIFFVFPDKIRRHMFLFASVRRRRGPGVGGEIWAAKFGGKQGVFFIFFEGWWHCLLGVIGRNGLTCQLTPSAWWHGETPGKKPVHYPNVSRIFPSDRPTAFKIHRSDKKPLFYSTNFLKFLQLCVCFFGSILSSTFFTFNFDFNARCVIHITTCHNGACHRLGSSLTRSDDESRRSGRHKEGPQACYFVSLGRLFPCFITSTIGSLRFGPHSFFFFRWKKHMWPFFQNAGCPISPPPYKSIFLKHFLRFHESGCCINGSDPWLDEWPQRQWESGVPHLSAGDSRSVVVHVDKNSDEKITGFFLVKNNFGK